jgi:hypothetical protein
MYLHTYLCAYDTYRTYVHKGGRVFYAHFRQNMSEREAHEY